jgi:hypothetical protein
MDNWIELIEPGLFKGLDNGLVLVFLGFLVAINYNTNIDWFIGLYNWTFTLI